MAGVDRPSSQIGPAPDASPTSPSGKFDPVELLARLWRQNLPEFRVRVAALEDAAEETEAGTLTPATRAKACDRAHKLAGSLGMFGYPRGTEIAREVEQILESDEEPDPAKLLKLTSELRALLPL